MFRAVPPRTARKFPTSTMKTLMGETFEPRSCRMDACTKLCATELNVDDTFGIARRLEEREGTQGLLRLVVVPDSTFWRDRGSLHTQRDGARGGECFQ